jgi:hypothetical protein
VATRGDETAEREGEADNHWFEHLVASHTFRDEAGDLERSNAVTERPEPRSRVEFDHRPVHQGGRVL